MAIINDLSKTFKNNFLIEKNIFFSKTIENMFSIRIQKFIMFGWSINYFYTLRVENVCKTFYSVKIV